ncbi:MAG: hypothetical protein ACMG6E_00465 [Candidatus Roizmanbacteria bacterium]
MEYLKRFNSFFVGLASKIPKRQRFILTTFILTILLVVLTFFSLSEIIYFVPLVIVIVYFGTYFSLLEGITKAEWAVLFISPVFFTIVFLFFYYFLPQRWLTRLPFAILYSIALYAILLSQNIFNVGVEKSLQLARAAFSVNYLFVTITFFMSSSILFSLGLPFYQNVFWMALVSFLLNLQFLWTIEPKEYVEKILLHYGLFMSIVIGEVSLILSFLPLSTAISALAITGVFYGFGGLLQSHLQERLFKEKIREYSIVLLFIAAIVLLTLRWN